MVFQEIAEKAYFVNGKGWEEYKYTIRDLALYAIFHDRKPQLSDDLALSLTQSLSSGNRLEIGRAAFISMRLSRLYKDASGEEQCLWAKQFQPLRDALGQLLTPDDPPLALAASWALAWIGASRLPSTPPEPSILLSLYRLWRNSESKDLARFAAWAFVTQPLLPRDTFKADVWGDCDAWFEQLVENLDQLDFNTSALMILAWYRRIPWNDEELAEKLGKIGLARHSYLSTTREILATLGEPGRRVLNEWDEKAEKAAG